MQQACHHGRRQSSPSRVAVAVQARKRSDQLTWQLLRALVVYTTWMLLVIGLSRYAGAAGTPESGPIVSIVQPTYNDRLIGLTQVLVTVEARKHTPQSLEMFVDGKTATNGPISMAALTLPSAAFNWDTKYFADGAHKLVVRVTDTQGFIGQAEVNIYINNSKLPDTTAPTITWPNLQANSMLHGVVNIDLKIADDFGVKWLIASVMPQSGANKALMQWMLNRPPYSIEFDTRKLPDGKYVFKGTVWDSSDNEGDAPAIPFTVNNRQPDLWAALKTVNPITVPEAPQKTVQDQSDYSNTGNGPLPVPNKVSDPNTTVVATPGKITSPAVSVEDHQNPVSPTVVIPDVVAPKVNPVLPPTGPAKAGGAPFKDDTRPAGPTFARNDTQPTRQKPEPGKPTMTSRGVQQGARTDANEKLYARTERKDRIQLDVPGADGRVLPPGAKSMTRADSKDIELAIRDIVQPGTPVLKYDGPRIARLTAPQQTQRVVVAPASASASRMGEVNSAIPNLLAPGQVVMPDRSPAGLIAVPTSPTHFDAVTSVERLAISGDPLILFGTAARVAGQEAGLRPSIPAGTMRAVPALPLAPAQPSSVLGVLGSVMSPSLGSGTVDSSTTLLARNPAPSGNTRPEYRRASPDQVRASTAPSSRPSEFSTIGTGSAPAAPRPSLAARPTGSTRPVYRGAAQPSAVRGQGESMASAPATLPTGGAQGNRVARSTAPQASDRIAYKSSPQLSAASASNGSRITNNGSVAATPQVRHTAPRATLPQVASLPPMTVGRTASMAPIKVAPIALNTVLPASYVTRTDATLNAIAARFEMSPALLAATNNLRLNQVVKAGTRLQVPRPLQVSYQGKPVTGDVNSMLVGSTAVTPFRHLFERQGGKLSWDAAHQRVTAKNGTHEVTLQIGSRAAQVNDKEVMMDLAAFLVSGRTMVPLRFFESALHAKVEWEPATGRIYMAMTN